jgi:glucan 1,4-alpha-glucosidase
MKIFYFQFFLLFSVFGTQAQTYTLTSPKKIMKVNVSLTSRGEPVYGINYKGREVVLASSLGLELANGSFKENFTVSKIDSTSVNENWRPVWGEVKEITNNYKEYIFHLAEKTNKARLMNIVFRLFDDGIGFRYEFPTQTNLQHFVIKEELTGFQLTGDHKTFWIPGDYDTNEYTYTTSNLSEVDGMKVKDKAPEIGTRFVKDASSVQTPLTMKTKDGLYINIHEASLLNYPAMQLHVDKAAHRLSSSLVPDALGNKAYLQTPSKTPWRTIIVSDKAADLLSSKLILNLNEPSKIENTSWIKPTKYIGIWWEMHVGKGTWDFAGSQDMFSMDNTAGLKPSGKHVATTERTKQYIDFAAQHGFDGILVEGWNTGWEDWFGNWKEDVFDFITPYPDFNVKELQQYASAKGVKLIMHHETSGSVTNYERWMDTAYDFMKANGYDAVKTGYVGKIIPRGEYHDGQWMVRHYQRVAEKTAAKQIMLDAHEPVRSTGLHRTYPNWLASEAARGNEFNAWSTGNPPEHETILPFSRLMGGPMDYTPGIFGIKLDRYGKAGFQVHTTLAKQLALYVTMYSPLQMAADLPEAYNEHLDAFLFIKDVGVDWDDTKIIEAEPGDFISIARKQKGKDNWFIGAITDENKRIAVLPLAFLDKGKKYVATVYKDAASAHWQKNPEVYVIEKGLVDAKTVLSVQLAEGGGCAISIMPATASEVKQMKRLK